MHPLVSMQTQPVLHISCWGFPPTQKQHLFAGSHKAPSAFWRPHLPASQTLSLQGLSSGPHLAPSFPCIVWHFPPSQKSTVQGSPSSHAIRLQLESRQLPRTSLAIE